VADFLFCSNSITTSTQQTFSLRTPRCSAVFASLYLGRRVLYAVLRLRQANRFSNFKSKKLLVLHPFYQTIQMIKMQLVISLIA